MPVPLIGITAGRTQSRYGYHLISLVEAYVQAVVRAGGAPVVIPLGLPEASGRELASRLDGILFSGGGDIHPERYGSELHPLVDGVVPDRDQIEIQLAQEAYQAGKPFLGVCRGLQLVNVALGGTIYEDILDQHPGAIRHQYSLEQPRDYRAHCVSVIPGSRLAAILDDGRPAAEAGHPVNSLHHQGIRRLAPGLLAAATAPDGIIEAIEAPGLRFGLAVQWHPEWMQDDPGMVALFRAFVAACQP